MRQFKSTFSIGLDSYHGTLASCGTPGLRKANELPRMITGGVTRHIYTQGSLYGKIKGYGKIMSQPGHWLENIPWCFSRFADVCARSLTYNYIRIYSVKSGSRGVVSLFNEHSSNSRYQLFMHGNYSKFYGRRLAFNTWTTSFNIVNSRIKQRFGSCFLMQFEWTIHRLWMGFC